MTKINQTIANQISEAISSGMYEINDEEKAIRLKLDGVSREALVLNAGSESLTNVYCSRKTMPAVNDLYESYAKLKGRKTSRLPDIDTSKNKKKENSKIEISFHDMKKTMNDIQKLRNEINDITKKMKYHKVDCTGMNESQANITTEEKVNELHKIKKRGEQYLDAALKYTQVEEPDDIAISEEREKSDFKETKHTILSLIEDTNRQEKRIREIKKNYRYEIKNPGNVSEEKRNKYWETRHAKALDRISELAGHKLRDNNPGITDLSDPKRPQKISEHLAALYDNLWTDALEVFQDKDLGGLRPECILLDMLMLSHKVCEENLNLENDTKDTLIMNMIKMKFENIDITDSTVKQYLKECSSICNNMCMQRPPLVFGQSINNGDKGDSINYRTYTKSGESVDYMVWPPLLLAKDNALLSKGVAQMR